MKVKVLPTSTASRYWYGKHVGEVFEVAGLLEHLGVKTGDYEVFDPDTGETAIIAAKDCELLPEQ